MRKSTIFSNIVLSILMICCIITSHSNISIVTMPNASCDNYILVSDSYLYANYHKPSQNQTGEGWEKAYRMNNLTISNKYYRFYYTTRFVIISNSTFMNVLMNMNPLFDLTGSRNIRFFNCTFIDNDICIQITDSNNIIIESCKFIKNAYPVRMINTCNLTSNFTLFQENYHAIEMYSNCRSNLFYANNFTENIDVKYAYQEGANNKWDNGSLGNYYDDYDILYPTANYDFSAVSLKFINDASIPLGIIYGVGSIQHLYDRYPFHGFKIDTSLIISQPMNNSQHKTIPQINLQYDPKFVRNVQYTIGGSSAIIYPNQISENIWNEVEEGTHAIVVTATDAFSNMITRNITIIKNTMGPEFTASISKLYYGICPPEITIIPIDAIQRIEVNITGVVIERMAESSEFLVVIPNIVWVSVPDGEINMEITAFDVLDNSNVKIVSCIKDSVKPNIENSDNVISISDDNLKFAEIKIINLETKHIVKYENIQQLNLNNLELVGYYLVVVTAEDLAGNIECYTTEISNPRSDPMEPAIFALCTICLACVIIIVCKQVKILKLKRVGQK